MRKFLINNDTFDELWIFDSPTSFGDDLDQVEVNILALKVSNMEHCLHSKISIVFLTLADNLWTKGSCGTFSEEFVVVFLDIKLFLDVIDPLDGDITSALKSISNFEWVDALIEEFLCLLEDGSSEYDNTGGSVTNFIVLWGW